MSSLSIDIVKILSSIFWVLGAICGLIGSVASYKNDLNNIQKDEMNHDNG